MKTRILRAVVTAVAVAGAVVSLGAIAGDVQLASRPIVSKYKGNEAMRGCLVPSTRTIVPGEPFRVGLLLRPQPGWRVHSVECTDIGWPPSLEWKLPEGFTASPLRWPKGRLVTDGAMRWSVYDDTALAICEITPPKSLQQREIVIAAHAQWTCETNFVTLSPVDAALELRLAVGRTEKPINQELFSKHDLAMRK
jgi:thiol:disulfide interchange protein DsbD